MSLLDLPVKDSRARLEQIENAIRETLAAHNGRMKVSQLKAETEDKTGCSGDEVSLGLARLEAELTDDGRVYLVD